MGREGGVGRHMGYLDDKRGLEGASGQSEGRGGRGNEPLVKHERRQEAWGECKERMMMRRRSRSCLLYTSPSPRDRG
eukprot:57046-Rhodomonas_salina.1